MPDLFDNFDRASPEQQATVISRLEQRNADPDRRAILESYLAEMTFPPGARVLDVGCGSGAITRVLARWPRVREAVGIDPWIAFIDKASELGAGIANLSFHQADGHALPFPDASFDAAVFHTALIHMDDPATALAEAHRVLRAGGWLSIFDPDPLAYTYAIAEHDPLQTAWEANIAATYLHPWLPRQLPGLVRAAGFTASRARTYGTVEMGDEAGAYRALDAGVQCLAHTGVIGSELAAALRGEARRRVEAGTFVRFGTMVSVLARKAG
jgi:ubiquinone/menaquinone biosynthesis C-methylase UbiE